MPIDVSSKSLGLAPPAPDTSTVHCPFGVSISSPTEYKEKGNYFIDYPGECLVFYVCYIYFAGSLNLKNKEQLHL